MCAAVLAASLPAARAIGDPPAYAWSLVAATNPPSSMHPGEKLTLAVVGKNEGSATWLADAPGVANPVRLAAVTPLDRSSPFASEDPTWLWSGGKRIRMATPFVPPGGVGVFAFTFTAPQQSCAPVDYVESFAPVAEGLAVMDPPAVTFSVRVRCTANALPPIPNPPIPQPPGLPCDPVSDPVGCSPVPPPEPPCDPAADPAGCVPPPPPPPCEPATDPAGCSPVPLPSPPPPPSPAGTHAWSLVAATSPPASMHPGLKLTLAVVARNEGTASWFADGVAAANPVRLAAVTPLDRSSPFGSEDPTWMWSGGKRIRMETPVVRPGDVGLFLFTFTAPQQPCSAVVDHSESFAPVAEGLAVMDPPAVTFSVRVRCAANALPPIPNPPIPQPPQLPCDPLADPVGCSPVEPPQLPCDPLADPVGCSPVEPPQLPCDPLADPVGCSPVEPPPLPCDPLADPVGCSPVEPPPPCDPTSDPLACVPQPPPIGGESCAIRNEYRSHRDLLPPAVALGYGGFGTPIVTAGLDGPRAVAVDPAGKLVVADTGNDRVRRVDTQGNVLFTWGTAGTGNGQFSSPGGVAAGTNLRIYVADTGNDRIQVFSLGGVWLQTFGGTGSLPGQFDKPRGLAIVPTGVYAGALAIADAGNDRVQIVSPTGSPLDVVGAGQLEAPAAVSAYGGDLYVADTGHDRVVRFNAAGQIDGVWQGTQGPGCFEAPSGVLANEYGLFVADPAHDKIHRFSRAGPLLETWGSTGSDPNQMRGPAGLAMEVGNLWVAEETGDRLQRFHPFVSAAPPVPCGSDPFQCLPS